MFTITCLISTVSLLDRSNDDVAPLCFVAQNVLAFPQLSGYACNIQSFGLPATRRYCALCSGDESSEVELDLSDTEEPPVRDRKRFTKRTSSFAKGAKAMLDKGFSKLKANKTSSMLLCRSLPNTFSSCLGLLSNPRCSRCMQPHNIFKASLQALQ